MPIGVPSTSIPVVVNMSGVKSSEMPWRSTIIFFKKIIVRLNIGLVARDLVSVTVNRTVMHSNRSLALFFFRNFLGFMKPTISGERTLPTCPTSHFNTT